MVESTDRTWHGVFLEPLDVLLFRDGRPFDATNRVVSVLPTPQTVAGAVRSALLAASGFSFSKVRHYQGNVVESLRQAGADPGILDARLRGPWLAKAGGKDPRPQPLLPCPLNLRTAKHDACHWMVAKPVDPESVTIPGWNHADGLWPLKFPNDPAPKFDPVLLTMSGFDKYMAAIASDDNRLELQPYDDFVKPDDVYATDHRIGIEIDPVSLLTKKGELYGIGLLALRADYGIYLELEISPVLAELLDGRAIQLGGEGKSAKVSLTGGSAFSERTKVEGNGPAIAYLATPTFLTGRNLPNRPLPPESYGLLRSAASDRPIAVSGWDVARGGPRPTRFAVPAGAVYFFDSVGVDSGMIATFDDAAASVQEGWGFTITGNWSS